MTLAQASLVLRAVHCDTSSRVSDMGWYIVHQLMSVATKTATQLALQNIESSQTTTLHLCDGAAAGSSNAHFWARESATKTFTGYTTILYNPPIMIKQTASIKAR